MSNERAVNGDMEATLIKARFGNDVRKVSLHHNEDLSFDDLCLMMQRIFKIKSSANIALKYKDGDDDLITIADDNDLLLALRTERNLSLVVLSDSGDRTNIEKLASELELIRRTAANAIESLKMIRTTGLEPPVFGVGNGERPDTPAHKETVATIQPSVHEQVSSATAGVPHPPAPSAHSEKPALEVPASQQNIIKEFGHPPLGSCIDGTLQPPRDEPSNEPTTEIDISDRNQSAFAPVAVKQELNELDMHNTPGMTNATAPPMQIQGPAAHVPATPFSTMSQQPAQSMISQTVPSVPTQSNSFTPPPSQFGYLPPQSQNQFAPVSQYSAPVPPVQQIAPQYQTVPTVAPVPRMMTAPPTSTGTLGAPNSTVLPASMAPPTSQSVSMNNPLQTMPTYPPSQPSSTPTMYNQPPQGMPVVQQMSFSSNSTPVPSPYMQYAKQDTQNMPQHPSFSENQMMQQQQQQQQQQPGGGLPPSSMPSMSPPASTVPSSMATPPIGAPPMMQFSAAPGVNPFSLNQHTGHYPRTPFMPSTFQQ